MKKQSMKKQNLTFLLRGACALLLTVCSLACSLSTKNARHFDSPEEALSALNNIVKKNAHETGSGESVTQLFGPEGEYLIYSGDARLDKKRAKKFIKLFEESHKLEKQDDGSYTVILGKQEWPFPVPIVSGQKGWYFDAQAGEEEILTRRIGQNELTVLSIAGQVFLAQRLYASQDRDGDGKREYAMRFISEPHTKNGLYWPVENSEKASPLGPLLARAADEEYVLKSVQDFDNNEPQPFFGYYFQLLPRQKSSEIEEHAGMVKPGRYWFFAYPALYGRSGIMSFLMNEQGKMYEKDLGEEISSQPVLHGPPRIHDGWSRVQ